MLEWPLLLTAGLLGSAHCVGMCGPIALMIGAHTTSWRANLLRQVAYTAGRLFTYSILGASAGFGAHRLTEAAPWLWKFPAALSVTAGVILIHQGLRAAGWLRASTSNDCLTRNLFGSLLRSTMRRGAFLAGLFTGFLPCGLLYGIVALAASSGAISSGAATMAIFGLGTFPAMLLTGLGGHLLSATFRTRIFRVAAWSLIVTGVVSLARGASLFGTAPQTACPFCLSAQTK